MSDHYGSINISPDAPSPKKLSKAAPKRPVPRKKKKAPNRKGLFLAVIAFFCIASYFFAGSYIAPLLIQKYLPGFLENKTGLSISVKKVRLNPFNFHLIFSEVKSDLPNSIAKEPLIQIKSLFIDLDLTALIRNTFACDKLTIQNLQLNLTRQKDKSYNIPALSKLTTARQQGEIISFATLPFLFSLNNININDSRITFTDTITDKTHTVEKLQLAIPTLSNFSFQSKNYIQPHFSAIINGSQVQLSGEAVRLAENQGYQTRLSCSIESLDLVSYFSYLPASFPFALSKGRADTTLQIAFAPNKKQGERFQIDIGMNAANIAMTEKESNLQITVPVMKMDAVFMPLAKQLHVKSIITKKTHITGSRQQLSSTLHNLFSQIQKRKNFDSVIQIDQLLSDEGEITLPGDKTKNTKSSEWNTLQLSISNFHSKNTTATIHLSGKHSKKKSSFSWQGSFTDTGTLQGKLLLKEFPATSLFNQLTPDQNKSIQGSATFTGDIDFPANQDSTFSYGIDNGIVKLHDLKLIHEKNTWLKAESVRFTRLSRKEGRYNLGNIFLKNAELSLNDDNLPPLYKHLFSEEKRPEIKGIDFTGTLRLKTNTSQKKTVELTNITFQANKLDTSNNIIDNFAFSGKIGKAGVIKAKGMLSIAPTKIQANLAFTDVDSTQLAAFLSKWPLLKNSTSTLHGKGVFHFPIPSFQGSLRLTDTTLQTSAKKPLFQWKFMEFHKLNCNFSPFSLEAETLTLDEPQFQWKRDSSAPFQHLQKGMSTLFQNTQKENTIFPFTINKVNFKNGSVTIVDKRLSPELKTSLKNITGRINNFNTNAKGISSFMLNGTMEDSPLSLTGSITLFNDKTPARAKMQITDFPLVLLKKQLQSIPVKTKNAKLTLNTSMTENQSDFSSENEIIIKNIEPSNLKSDTALALAFLKDSRGAFPLNIQIGDSSRPLLKESIASFKTTTIKASYAPLLLDRQFKDLQDKDFISFHPGSNKMGATGLETLSRYAELLRIHPGTGLTITGMTDKKIDGNALLTILKEKEQQRIQAENEKRLATFRKNQKAARAITPGGTLQEEDIAKDELTGFIPLKPKPVKLASKVLPNLANERSLLVVDALIHSLGIAPNRILSAANKIKSPTDTTPSNGVRITIRAIATDVK